MVAFAGGLFERFRLRSIAVIGQGNDWLGLNDRSVVITGAASGIGKGIAKGFAEAGARVAILDRDGEGCRAVADEIGNGTISFECDVTDRDALAEVEADIRKKLGVPDILVNNAGIMRPGELADLSPELWDQVLAVNLSGYLNGTRAFSGGMRARGSGVLIHIASMSGSFPQPFSGAYSPSKAAVIMMSRQLAFELGPHGIRSNTVSPGMLRTAINEAFYADPELARRRDEACPLGRIGTPSDIADATVFLASPRAAYITGADLVVDGGFTQTTMSYAPRPGYTPSNRH